MMTQLGERQYVKRCFERAFDVSMPALFMGVHRTEFVMQGLLLFKGKAFQEYKRWLQTENYKIDEDSFWRNGVFVCDVRFKSFKVTISRKKYILEYTSDLWPTGTQVPLFPYRRVQRVLNIEDRILQILMGENKVPEEERWAC